MGLSEAYFRSYCDRKEPESLNLEFKGPLPYKNDSGDPWPNERNSLSNYTKAKLVGEVVALANGYGGRLILGVSETKERPPRAEELAPIGRIGQLADILEDVFRSRIEPQVYGLQAMGVCSLSDGTGFIEVIVPPSPIVHRSGIDQHVYVRHMTSAMKLSMVEIYDLVIQRRNMERDIEQTFKQRSLASYKSRVIPFDGGIRVTAIPARPILLSRPYEIADTEIQVLRPVSFRYGNNSSMYSTIEIDEVLFDHPVERTPRLRGSEYFLYPERSRYFLHETILEDGLIELVYGAVGDVDASDNDTRKVRAFMCIMLNVLRSVKAVRDRLSAPMIEYIIQSEHWSTSESGSRTSFGRSFQLPDVRLADDLTAAAHVIFDDLQNYFAKPKSKDFSVEW